MPGAFAALDTNLPDLSGPEGTERKLRALEDYLVQLLEQLRYTLHNLSQDNFNTAEVTGWLGGVITEPIRAAMESVESGLSARLDADEGRLSTLYTKTGVNELGQNETLSSRITQTAADITSEVTRAAGAESALSSRITQTAADVTSEVARASGAESAIRQSADAIRAQVTDGNGNFTVLNLRSDGLHVGSAAGTTTIRGDCITAGTVTAAQINAADLHVRSANIDGTITAGALTAAAMEAIELDAAQITSGTIVADRLSAACMNALELSADQVNTGTLDAQNIALKDSFDVYTRAGGTSLLVGTLGAGYGDDGVSPTYGVKLGSPYSQIYFIVTDAGVRMQCFGSSIYVTSGGCWAKYGNRTVDLIGLADRVAALESAAD